MRAEPSLIFSEKIGHFQQMLRGTVFTGRAGVLLEPEQGIERALEMLANVHGRQDKVFIIGNGGSAAVAGHIINDLVNTCKLHAATLHDAPLLTCMANDYGYEHAYARILETQARQGDLLIAVSSSGRSANIRNAVEAIARRGGSVITLSGFQAGNPLRRMGDLNLWLDSQDYGFVEVGHLFVLHHLVDRYKKQDGV